MNVRQKQREHTCEMILNGAEETFLKQGYSGASMKHIAEASGVTQSLIHHYYDNKAGLWAAVRKRCFQNIFESLRPGLSAAARGDDFLFEFTQNYYQYLRDTPEFMQLLAWIIAEKGTPPEESAGKSEQIVQIIEREQKNGYIRDDIPAEIILSLVWSLVEGWHLGRQQYAHRLGKDLNNSNWDNFYLDGLKKILISSFKKVINK
jgi:TetR/AcrR family transcriptional regulator